MGLVIPPLPSAIAHNKGFHMLLGDVAPPSIHVPAILWQQWHTSSVMLGHPSPQPPLDDCGPSYARTLQDLEWLRRSSPPIQFSYYPSANCSQPIKALFQPDADLPPYVICGLPQWPYLIFLYIDDAILGLDNYLKYLPAYKYL
ncbi:hypothetical protein KP509_07G023200 [Ceratopteris richardii]|uniref:Uncharacterized protein n=1 Tax=Ceratopteris richardii TaxID=49495 RepID=A0A8T2UD51_CERRI|nr:hypothetical protein KP509_07G023200 [Ceratopteris richardii]